jgi:hypothetical protein
VGPGREAGPLRATVTAAVNRTTTTHPGSRRRRALLCLLVAVAGALLAGCRAEARLTIDVHDDGSGVVTLRIVLDADAVDRLGGIEDQLAVGDIQAAGWEVRGGRDVPTGGFILEASKPFANPAALSAVIVELSGADGPFRDFRLARDSGRFQDGWTFSGIADVVEPYAGLDEPGFEDVLRGMGVDVAGLRQQLGTSISDGLQLEIRVAIPGTERGNFTRTLDGGAVWEVPSDETQQLVAESTSLDQPRIVRAGIAALLGVAALGLALRGITRIGRRRAGPGWDETPFSLGGGRASTLPRFGYLRRSRRIK